MIKHMISRGLNGFAYSIAITVVVNMAIMGFDLLDGALPLLPEYMEHFDSPTMALLVQCLLIGVISAAFGFGSAIMEAERIGLITQSILYFVITSAVWIPVACFCWGFHKYPGSMIGVTVSYLVSYFISWSVQYRICRKNIEEINQKLQEIGQA